MYITRLVIKLATWSISLQMQNDSNPPRNWYIEVEEYRRCKYFSMQTSHKVHRNFVYISILELAKIRRHELDKCKSQSTGIRSPSCLLITLFRKEYNSLNPLKILPGLAIFFICNVVHVLKLFLLLWSALDSAELQYYRITLLLSVALFLCSGKVE